MWFIHCIKNFIHYTYVRGVFHMSVSEKLVVIGIDAATLDIMMPLMKKGSMPNLKALMDDGVHGKLRSVLPPITPPAVVSFLTGKHPDKHGVFNFTHHSFRPFEKRQLVNASHIRCRTLWDMIGKKKRVIAVNYPLTYPHSRIDGILISGVPAPQSNRKFFYPAQIGQEIDEAVGGYMIENKAYMDSEYKKTSSYDKWLDMFFEIEEKHKNAAIYLMGNYPWDVFMHYFVITDRIPHLCWPRNIGFGELPKRIQDTYLEVDRWIGEILAAAGPVPNVMVFSDHGFGTEQWTFFINRWLMKEKLLVLKAFGKSGLTHGYCLKVKTVPFEKLLRRMGINLSGSALRNLKVTIPYPSRHLTPRLVDWSKTKAYGDNYGIYINRKGREPNGCVDANGEYEAVCKEIIQRLKVLKMPNGEKAFDRVREKEEMFPGAHADSFPDICFMREDLSLVQNHTVEIRRKNIFGNPHRGNHQFDGLVIAKGTGMRKDLHIENAMITDMLPTLLYCLGEEIPDDLDGHIQEKWFESSYLREHPIKYCASDLKPRSNLAPENYQDGDDEKIRNQLKTLGYL